MKIFDIILTVLTFIIQQDKVNILRGSSAYLLLNNNKIFLAADTKQVDIKDSGSEDAGKVCKIALKENIAYAMTGCTIITDVIDLDKDIANLKFKGKTFEQKVAEIKDRIKKSVLTIATFMKKERPVTFEKDYKPEDQFVSLLLAAFEKNKPVTGSIIFNIVKKPGNSLEIKETVKVDISGAFQFKNIGHTEAFNQVKPSIKQYFSQFNTEPELLNDLIKRQSLLTPNDVGMPADVLEISSNGFKWIQFNHSK